MKGGEADTRTGRRKLSFGATLTSKKRKRTTNNKKQRRGRFFSPSSFFIEPSIDIGMGIGTEKRSLQGNSPSISEHSKKDGTEGERQWVTE